MFSLQTSEPKLRVWLLLYLTLPLVSLTSVPISAQDVQSASQAAGTSLQPLSRYDVDAKTGLRMDRYRAPVPADVPGGKTLDTAEAYELQQSKAALFIDVYPPTGLGPDPLNGQWVTNEARESIPGAHWLPEVGRGTLEPEAEDYFRRNLARLTDNHVNAPVVFFCTADCWQSWNAARRAIHWGYTAVYWFPLGSDGWLEKGHDLTPIQPVNFLHDSTPDTQHSDAQPTGESSGFPTSALIYLQDQEGSSLQIGRVQFTSRADVETEFAVDIDSPAFVDQFLSMRPFRCLTGATEWFCHLPYPYELRGTVTAVDLTELEYQLLFIWKSSQSFGIDAWNGVYYRLTLQADGIIHGTLLQGDLNVLATPPDPYSHPIDLAEFISEGAGNRRYPSLVMRP